MPANRYPVSIYSKEELVKRFRAVNAAIEGGNQTHAGIEPGVYHEFQGKTDAELRACLMDIMRSLHEMDPATYPDPDGQKRMKITTRYC